MKIIGLTGYAGSGKDSVAKILVEKRGFVRVAFADPVRASYYALNPIIEVDCDRFPGLSYVRLQPLVDRLGWDEAKKIPDVRQGLQRMGTECGREVFGSECWVELASEKICTTLDQMRKPVVVTDVRFPEEIMALRDIGNYCGPTFHLPVCILRVHRPGVGPVNGHVSESRLEADATLYNFGTLEDLERAALEYVDSI